MIVTSNIYVMYEYYYVSTKPCPLPVVYKEHELACYSNACIINFEAAKKTNVGG